ncbi:major facilitator superfamily domain-containing protein, partial [Whalleya microplaca]
MSPYKPPPLRQRSNTLFILATAAIGLFTVFLYNLIVLILPFMLRTRLAVPEPEIQSYVSGTYAGASVVSSVPAGWVAGRADGRQSIAVLVVARVLQGVSAAVFWTVGLAMVLDTVGPIFSFISIGELLAPVIGGALYEKTGSAGVFGVAAGVLALDFLMRLAVVEKKTAAKYEGALGRTSAPGPRRDSGTQHHHHNHNNNNNDDEEQATDDSALLPPPSPSKPPPSI